MTRPYPRSAPRQRQSHARTSPPKTDILTKQIFLPTCHFFVKYGNLFLLFPLPPIFCKDSAKKMPPPLFVKIFAFFAKIFSSKQPFFKELTYFFNCGIFLLIDRPRAIFSAYGADGKELICLEQTRH